VHRALLPAPKPPVELFEQKTTAPALQQSSSQRPSRRGNSALRPQPPVLSSIAPAAGEPLGFVNVSRPVTATSGSAGGGGGATTGWFPPVPPSTAPAAPLATTPMFPSPFAGAGAGVSVGGLPVVQRSAGKPVSSGNSEFGALSQSLAAAAAAMAGQGVPSRGNIDPYRGDAYSRGDSSQQPQAHQQAQSARASRTAHYRAFFAAYGVQGAATARPATSAGVVPARPSHHGHSGSTGSAASGTGGNSGGGGGGVMSPRHRPATGSGAAESLNRSILDAALQRAAARQRQGRSKSRQRSRTSASSGSESAYAAAASPQRVNYGAATEGATPPPAQPPVASLRDGVMQQPDA